jgi:hypothetical protein
MPADGMQVAIESQRDFGTSGWQLGRHYMLFPDRLP